MEHDMKTPCYSPIPAAAYYATGYYQQEVEKIFAKAWLLVGVMQELPEPGDYMARDILGVPVIVWNDQGVYRAYVNVCPHRHAMLVNTNSHGSSETLTCPYHGWEFNGKGNVCKIPDAECFKGLKKEGSHALRALPLETLENLIFIRLNNEEAETLADFLGPDVYAEVKRLSKRSSRLMSYRQVDLPCNWKLMYENGTEDYHTPLIHKATFGKNLVLKDARIFYQKTENQRGCLMSGHAPEDVTGFNIHAPIATISLFSGLHITIGNHPVKTCTFEQELPVGPTASKRGLWLMCNKRLDDALVESLKLDVIKIQLEDEELMGNNQIGKQHAYSPQLLGLYETRIGYFHDYLATEIYSTDK